MKKSRGSRPSKTRRSKPVSSRKKPRSSSKSTFFKRRSKPKSGPSGGFVKPSHDPGPKIRPEESEVVEDYVEEENLGPTSVQQSLQSTGCGCCSSITGLLWLIVIGVIAAIIIMVLKCGC